VISDAAIADYVLALYDYAGGPQVQWDHLQPRSADDGISWAFKRIGENDLIVLEGTSSIQDIIRDLVAVSDPTTHSPLGPLHIGFWDGMMEAWDLIRRIIRKPVIVCGHSLGGAHAAILAGIMVVNHQPPVRRVTFGEPRAGCPKLREVVSGVPTTIYHNHRDVISDLPISLPPLAPYCDSGERTLIDVKPHGRSLLWGPFAYHHMQLYREGIKDVAVEAINGVAVGTPS